MCNLKLVLQFDGITTKNFVLSIVYENEMKYTGAYSVS